MVKLDEDQMKLCFEEHSQVKEELRHLKDCQVKYFSFSITATALILTILARFGSFSQIQNVDMGIVFLFPLLILIPCWLIFFDKAKTITRGVAYYRFIEKRIIGEEQFEIKGWENSLNNFRELRGGKNESFWSKLKIWPSKQDLKTSVESSVGNYWLLIYLSFFALSWVCILASLFVFGISLKNLVPNSYSKWIFYITVILVFITSLYNLKNYSRLVGGKHSYKNNFKEWKKVLYPLNTNKSIEDQ